MITRAMWTLLAGFGGGLGYWAAQRWAVLLGRRLLGNRAARRATAKERHDWRNKPGADDLITTMQQQGPTESVRRVLPPLLPPSPRDPSFLIGADAMTQPAVEEAALETASALTGMADEAVAMPPALSRSNSRARSQEPSIQIREGGQSRSLVAGPYPMTIGSAEGSSIGIDGAAHLASLTSYDGRILVERHGAGPCWLGGRPLGARPVPVTSSNAVLEAGGLVLFLDALAASPPSLALDHHVQQRPRNSAVLVRDGRLAMFWTADGSSLDWASAAAAAAIESLVEEAWGAEAALEIAFEMAGRPRGARGLVAVTSDSHDQGPTVHLAGGGDAQVVVHGRGPSVALSTRPIGGLGWPDDAPHGWTVDEIVEDETKVRVAMVGAVERSLRRADRDGLTTQSDLVLDLSVPPRR